MSRTKLEEITASLGVILLFADTLGAILLAADQIFGWDLFSMETEKVLGFIMIAALLLIVASVLVNVMLNLGIIAKNATKIANQIKK